jgi:hypothetical protein
MGINIRHLTVTYCRIKLRMAGRDAADSFAVAPAAHRSALPIGT